MRTIQLPQGEIVAAVISSLGQADGVGTGRQQGRLVITVRHHGPILVGNRRRLAVVAAVDVVPIRRFVTVEVPQPRLRQLELEGLRRAGRDGTGGAERRCDRRRCGAGSRAHRRRNVETIVGRAGSGIACDPQQVGTRLRQGRVERTGRRIPALVVAVWSDDLNHARSRPGLRCQVQSVARLGGEAP